ncbi:tyrosine-protein phosphatase [Levilactobacillus yiduensis]|uniref:tyrosine-protein phosphatase n=1 Tax=Levilactobacillus yiduensis TaxID=2953880 RepID=UPI000EF299EF|nr:tyrosine-protein phosphatase [Levilactobacillus yiduensis]AYM02414.1 tyrosine-protein phosphatase [Levilactobacillus brevis]
MPERLLNLTAGFNFRDLGGYQGSNGRTVKWRKLWRTAHLASLTAEDSQKLIDAGIGVVIDLRSTAEVQQFPDQLGSLQSIHLPVFDNDETESAASAAELERLFSREHRGGYLRMMRVYRRLVISPQAQQAYSEFLQLILKLGGQCGIIFHCSAGKDRTGMAAVFLLRALGVAPETVLADYLLTNPASEKHISDRVAAVPIGPGRQNFRQSVRDLASVHSDYYNQAMCLINYEYGGMSAYLTEILRFSLADQAKLQKLYLV